MHYYQFNIADYRKRTGHLTLVEHAVYRLLIDTYYLEEVPLPLDNAKTMRLLCVRTEDEKDAYHNILDEFFELKEDGYHHEKCDEELSKIYDKSEKARKSAKKRWEKHANALRTHSEGNANGMLPKDLNTSLPNNPLPKDPKDQKITSSEDDDLFNQFWSAGMRKVSKQSAAKAFAKVLKSQPDKQSFTDRLVFDIQNRLRVGQMGFAEMHPTTYLNGMRWEDEPPKPKQSGGESFDDRMNQLAAERGEPTGFGQYTPADVVGEAEFTEVQTGQLGFDQ